MKILAILIRLVTLPLLLILFFIIFPYHLVWYIISGKFIIGEWVLQWECENKEVK